MSPGFPIEGRLHFTSRSIAKPGLFSPKFFYCAPQYKALIWRLFRACLTGPKVFIRLRFPSFLQSFDLAADRPGDSFGTNPRITGFEALTEWSPEPGNPFWGTRPITESVT